MTERVLGVEQAYEAVINDNGSLSLPPTLLEQVGLKPGDPVRVVLIDGELKLLPMRLVVSQMAAEISQIMVEEGVTFDELMAGLDEAGEEVFRETYGDASTT